MCNDFHTIHNHAILDLEIVNENQIYSKTYPRSNKNCNYRLRKKQPSCFVCLFFKNKQNWSLVSAAHSKKIGTDACL